MLPRDCITSSLLITINHQCSDTTNSMLRSRRLRLCKKVSTKVSTYKSGGIKRVFGCSNILRNVLFINSDTR